MKFPILAGLVLAGLAWSVQADETDSGAVAAAESAAVESAAAKGRIRTDLANDMLATVTARVGADLETRLERDVGDNTDSKHPIEKLLASTR